MLSNFEFKSQSYPQVIHRSNSHIKIQKFCFVNQPLIIFIKKNPALTNHIIISAKMIELIKIKTNLMFKISLKPAKEYIKLCFKLPSNKALKLTNERAGKFIGKIGKINF